jgi:hypothetical protein
MSKNVDSWDDTLYVPRKTSIKKLIDNLAEVESSSKLAGLFALFPREFGFDHATVLILSEGRNHFLKHRVLSSLPRPQREFLTSRAFIESHPLLQELQMPEAVCFFPNYRPDSSGIPLDPDAKDQTLNEGSGVAFRIDFPSGMVAMVILNTARKAPWNLKQFTKSQRDIYALSYEFIDSFVFFSSIGSPSVAELTTDEKKFLRLTATSENPQEAFSHRYRYGGGQNMQTSIARKFGVKTIFQAVALAVKRGLIELDSIDHGDILHNETTLEGWNLANLMEQGGCIEAAQE